MGTVRHSAASRMPPLVRATRQNGGYSISPAQIWLLGEPRAPTVPATSASAPTPGTIRLYVQPRTGWYRKHYTTTLAAICPLAPVNGGRKTQDPAALLGAQCLNRVDGGGAQSWQQAGDNRDEGKHRCNGGEPDWIEGGDSVEHLFDEPYRDYQSNCARHKSSRQQDERL